MKKKKNDAPESAAADSSAPETVEQEQQHQTPEGEAAAAGGEPAEAAAETVADAGEEQQPGDAEQAVQSAAAGEEMAPEQLGVEEKHQAGETEQERLRAMLEAAVYIAEDPVTIAQLCQALNQPKEVIEPAMAQLVADYTHARHGIAVREVAGGFKMSTKPEYHEDIRAFVKKLRPPLKLSLAALETLAVVAYKQPITAPEILEIRGVQGGGVLKTLLERKLITAAGRKQVVGRPVLYKTTKEFLMQFGLKDLAELPTLKEFEEWSRLALGEGEEPQAAPEAMPAAEPQQAALEAAPVVEQEETAPPPVQDEAAPAEQAEAPPVEQAEAPPAVEQAAEAAEIPAEQAEAPPPQPPAIEEEPQPTAVAAEEPPGPVAD